MRLRHLTLFAALLCASTTLYSCGPLSRVDWPKVATCGAPAGDEIIGTVSRVLLQDGHSPSLGDAARGELEDLAREHGPKLIACLVHELVDAWTSPGAAYEPTRAAGAARGQGFLDAVGTTIETTETQP